MVIQPHGTRAGRTQLERDIAIWALVGTEFKWRRASFQFSFGSLTCLRVA